MHRARRKKSPSPLFFAALLLTLCIFPALALAASSSSSSSSSTNPDDELICHTSDPSECYPRVFKPSNEFQTVHGDQEIPKGLHVRMNMTSGKLEAKINVEGEVPPELEGVAHQQAVLVVEPEEPGQPRIPKDAPKYEPVGKIKEPEPQSEDAKSFAEALKMATLGGDKLGGDFDDTLEWLEEISHDIYYGLKIAEDKAALGALFCLMVEDREDSNSANTRRGQQAAAILAGALSNNPTAVQEVSKDWENMMGSVCPGDTHTLRQRFYSSFVPQDSARDSAAASKAKARVAAINGLIKDDAIRADFLRSGGMNQVLEVLVPEGEDWASAQRKAGQLALDNFLDEDMGATLGQWPVGKCQQQQQEGCWDDHVERIMKANKGGEHWSKDLHDRLAAARKDSGRSAERAEL
ncbi:Nucleotide exchange factor-like protein [Hapsidospora chrysogenum ATCC 11550]|uniref:Nucleotide exchange factor-like protein n=1 Tax=Hapsidospora chrysogenum (strain ATCC 11550 / CBS 779.69 / DSM 880 / IAM 14645 / JCM 23072 / IMI 49137) TaxID=857340 RepID=A0A086SW96_HAPC1|nr:Nucleotide exchange factor-like protein [Hapsidospora chrysogenum ATCC 11550]